MVRYVIQAVVSVLVALFTPVACVMVVLATLIFLPLPATLPQPRPNAAPNVTHVLDANGNEIGIYKKFDTNIPVEPDRHPASPEGCGRRRGGQELL